MVAPNVEEITEFLRLDLHGNTSPGTRPHSAVQPFRLDDPAPHERLSRIDGFVRPDDAGDTVGGRLHPVDDIAEAGLTLCALLSALQPVAHPALAVAEASHPRGN